MYLQNLLYFSCLFSILLIKVKYMKGNFHGFFNMAFSRYFPSYSFFIQFYYLGFVFLYFLFIVISCNIVVLSCLSCFCKFVFISGLPFLRQEHSSQKMIECYQNQQVKVFAELGPRGVLKMFRKYAANLLNT